MEVSKTVGLVGFCVTIYSLFTAAVAVLV